MELNRANSIHQHLLTGANIEISSTVRTQAMFVDKMKAKHWLAVLENQPDGKRGPAAAEYRYVRPLYQTRN